MKLYKFRSLGSCQDLIKARMILETGEFWCSRFWELNDPMEGVYCSTNTDKHSTSALYDEKSRRAICSFSGENAFGNPLMWGYYANGFRGIAIEIKVNCEASKITEINYTDEISKIGNDDDKSISVKHILTTKLNCWSHENEYRYIDNDNKGPRKIGNITAVYFGNPYDNTDNAKDVQSRPRLREYLCLVETLKKTAQHNNIEWKEVIVDKGSVRARKTDENL